MSPNTSTTVLDSSGHPPVEAIAEYLEELLPPAAAEELRSHFAGCPECLDTHAALEEIRSLLGRTESPRLPDDIGIRIDAALAAESLLSANEPAAEPATEPTAAPAPEIHRTASGSASGDPGARTGSSRPPQGPAGRATPPGPAGRRPGEAGRRWRRAVVGLAALAAIGFVGTAVLQNHGNSNGAAKSGSAAGRPASPPLSGLAQVQFTAADLPQQIQELLRGTQPTSGTAVHLPVAGTESSVQPLHTSGRTATGDVPPCVLQATGRTDRPLAARAGSYQDKSAIAVVYQDTENPEQLVDVYLVDTSCTQETIAVQAASRKDDVLLTQTLPSR